MLITADRQEIGRVIANLCGNAVNYTNPNGRIEVTVKEQCGDFLFSISDNGNGIENIEIAKQPLYTTRPNLERSGMGFTIMESFMDELNVESIVGLGTKVTMKKKIKQNMKKAA